MSQHQINDGAAVALLDRLVGDELTPEERSKTLRWIEADPRRWRQCALVFLEAQVWRRALRTEPLTPPVALPDLAAPSAKPARSTRAWLMAAALALVAFLGGWGGASWLNRGPSSQEFASKSADSHPADATDGRPINGVEKQVAVGTSPDAMKTLFASFGLVRGGSNNETAALKVPVSVDESAFNPEVDVLISESERKKWEQRGLRVSKVREYVPGKLPDGKPVVMSVDRLRVERVGVPTI